MKTVTVTVDKSGKTKIDAAGFVGGECLRTTAELERRLGAKEETREKKPELDQTEAEHINA